MQHQHRRRFGIEYLGAAGLSVCLSVSVRV